MENFTEQEITLIEVGRVLSEYKIRFEELIKRKIMDSDKIATGNLLASINVELEVEGNHYVVYLNSLKYLKYIEEGRKPGKWPPTEPILKWVQDKKLPTKELYGGDLPTEKQLTYLVKKKIALEGIDPVPVIANTIEELNEIYIPKLEDALRMDILNSLPLIKIQLKFNI